MSTFNVQNYIKNKQFSEKYLIKPKNDDINKYKLLVLPNNIQVMLINNNQTQFSSVALDIKAGSWLEQTDTPGLAHFLEHMSFVQSEQYPEKFYLDKILSRNGGLSNAFTTNDHTNYFFKTKTSSLEECLKVFANMFISPIFNDEVIQKEIKVIENEYQLNLNQDEFKINKLLTLLSDQKSPFSRFSLGNQNSLQSINNLQERLKEFQTKYYVGNLMKLVIYSNEDLEKLQQYTQIFAQIKDQPQNSQKPDFSIYGKPLKDLGKLIKLKLNSENTHLYLIYQLNIDKKAFKKRALEFLTYFLENRTEGSLYYELKEKITDINTQILLQESKYVLFQITFVLKKQQIQKYNEIINSFINYIQFIKEKGLIDTIYHERAKISDLEFTYRQKQTFSEKDVSQFAFNLNTFNYKEVFVADKIFQEQFDKKYVSQIIEQIQDLENNSLIILGSSTFEEENSQNKENNENTDDFLTNDIFENEDSLYNIQYSEIKLTAEQIENLLEINTEKASKYTKEPRNTYVPFQTKLVDICNQNDMLINEGNISGLQGEKLSFAFQNFDYNPDSNEECLIEDFLQTKKNPSLIKYENGIEGWYKFDQYYQTPKNFGYFSIQFPERQNDIQQVASGLVYATLFTEFVSEQLFSAIEAGNKIDISYQMASLKIKLIGWSENFKELVLSLFTIWEKMELNEEKYILSKSKTIQNLQEMKSFTTLEQGEKFFLPKSIFGTFYELEEIIKSVQKITFEDIKNKNDKNKTKLVAFIGGNIQAKQAQEILNEIQDISSFNTNNQEYQPKQKILKIQPSNTYQIRQKVISQKGNLNRAIVNYYQCDIRNNIDLAKMNIIINNLDTFLYDYLGTEQQLGYIIESKLVTYGNIDGFLIKVMGDKNKVTEMSNYVNRALMYYKQQIEVYMNKYFEETKKSVLAVLKSRKNSLEEDLDFNIQQIEQFKFNFFDLNDFILKVESLTKDDVLDFFEQIFFDQKKLVSIQVHNYNDKIVKTLSEDDNISNDQIKVVLDINKDMVGLEYYEVEADLSYQQKLIKKMFNKYQFEAGFGFFLGMGKAIMQDVPKMSMLPKHTFGAFGISLTYFFTNEIANSYVRRNFGREYLFINNTIAALITNVLTFTFLYT
ncbi:insulinase family, putative [Ichthyophthirius multifiliis]|uniref:Insulinase family, putative n=1 Tax=Ichthyophthirius multifiliis TaxID=5932 RepID=G0R0A2_ICHMU|nr:insulinase family, putative [Ichthyophthirius multifiliis]EGR29110.1 insulinase family, putative [Ichthyophthirius multifiliis]|eukprot:XP_004030346.1 insulinase family, putative [Ichthyophthirius multifiliis]